MPLDGGTLNSWSLEVCTSPVNNDGYTVNNNVDPPINTSQPNPNVDIYTSTVPFRYQVSLQI